MSFSFPLGRVLGIPVRVHASWFLVLALVTWTLGRGFFGEQRFALAWGLVTGLLIFGSVILHELGHCVFARMYGIHVRRIQLFLFGGVAEIVGEPRRVVDEIVIAAAGPAVSFALSIAAAAGLAAEVFASGAHGDLEGVLFRLSEGEMTSPIFGVLFVLASSNFALGVFNLIPAFPTDGGRILRAILWGLLGDYRRATTVAAGLGLVFAGGFIVLGVGSALTATWRADASQVAGARIGGLWWALIGIFLARSATQAASSAKISAALRAGRLSDVMGPVRAAVPAERTLLEVLVGIGGPSASEMLLDGFPAASDGRLVGFVEPSRMHVVPREQWGTVRVADVMTPIDSLPRLQADEPLDSLLRALAENGTGVLVLRGDELVGYASRADLGQWLFRDGGPAAD